MRRQIICLILTIILFMTITNNMQIVKATSSQKITYPECDYEIETILPDKIKVKEKTSISFTFKVINLNNSSSQYLISDILLAASLLIPEIGFYSLIPINKVLVTNENYSVMENVNQSVWVINNTDFNLDFDIRIPDIPSGAYRLILKCDIVTFMITGWAIGFLYTSLFYNYTQEIQEASSFAYSSITSPNQITVGILGVVICIYFLKRTKGRKNEF